MTSDIYAELVPSLQRGAMAVSDFHALAWQAGSTWSAAQVELFLRCLDGVEVADGSVRLGKRTEAEELAEALLQVVQANGGKPLSASEVRRRLPDRFVTSDEQIKAMARKLPGLEVFGPGLIRSN
jgi:hypothetical protein